MEGLLTGKLVLVTGAGSGIGEALCHVLLREGSKVAAVDINPINPKKFSTSEDFFKEFQADISLQKEVTKLYEKIETHFGYAPDGVVNCAGILKATPFLDLDEKQFDEVIQVNLKIYIQGTFIVCQIVAKSLVKRMEKDSRVKGGSIVNISSIAATAGAPTYSGYSASKAGVLGLTKSIAKELGPYNIRCNAVLPGYIETPMTDCRTDSGKEHVKKNTTLGRSGQPEEVAEVCAFLLSDRSSFVTGSLYEVTGGLII